MKDEGLSMVLFLYVMDVLKVRAQLKSTLYLLRNKSSAGVREEHSFEARSWYPCAKWRERGDNSWWHVSAATFGNERECRVLDDFLPYIPLASNQVILFSSTPTLLC